MRRLGPKEIARRLAAGRARAERIAQQPRRPDSPQLQQAIERARIALALVVSDVESTTSVRERGDILRYDEWEAESAQDPRSWVLHGDDDEEDVDLADDDDELALACQFGGLTFYVDGDQSTSEIAADIASQVQDEVTEEVWAAWPECPGHQHPMSLAVVAGVAVWRCPVDVDVTVPIGQLSASPSFNRPSGPSPWPPE